VKLKFFSTGFALSFCIFVIRSGAGAYQRYRCPAYLSIVGLKALKAEKMKIEGTQ